eukprot:CAMPEP_0170498918 /NCGR_PEP_ID=MMETSP0208-20121228/29477_1 /TAXON_ID=197538 /ORGANISM="Strombidium inclinatum, Strain S3" /LENGTH=56 /DNA_ID=CAMNT_0010776261 /DNA_START=832 /DNA_END=1002 /DNA_ORIENTATION=-
MNRITPQGLSAVFKKTQGGQLMDFPSLIRVLTQLMEPAEIIEGFNLDDKVSIDLQL